MSGSLLLASLALATIGATGRAAQVPVPSPAFADFDRRARSGARLNVVFFGGSLTWGANATDPQTTSYRPRIAEKLEARYPKAHFHFFDAAIGGTGSQLGAFRVERDVLRRQPDLLFLDFSLNDGLDGRDEERFASYESIVRRTLTEAKCPVMMVYFPDAAVARSAGVLARVEEHRRLAGAYGCGEGDAITWMRERAARDPGLVDRWWTSPTDKTHPGDAGYQAYADAVWSGYEGALKRRLVGHLPAVMIHADTYLSPSRVQIARIAPLPPGWSAGEPNRISAWYDSLMSRWLDSEAIAQARAGVIPEPIRLHFHGVMALLFGESTPGSGRLRVLIDGTPATMSAGGVWDLSSRPVGGNVKWAEVVAQGLAPGEHTIELQPLLTEGQELRIESLCFAGAGASGG